MDLHPQKGAVQRQHHLHQVNTLGGTASNRKKFSFFNRLTVSLAMASACSAWAAPPAKQSDSAQAGEVAQLRLELQSLKSSYEARIAALEARLDRAMRAESQTAAIAGQATGTGTASTGTGTASTGTAGSAKAAGSTVSASASGSASVPPVFSSPSPSTSISLAGSRSANPNISLILSGAYARSGQDPEQASISGFPLPPGTELGAGFRGFSLGETELGLSANIDPWFRGVAHIGIESDNSVSIEEAYLQTIALGNGFGLKAGRFYSGVGYLNQQHRHVWDFIDAPLAYQAMLGGQLGDDGVQLRWLAPTDLLLEFGAELARGGAFPGGEPRSNGAGMMAVHAHAGGDLGASHSWRAGLSLLRARASDQAFGQDASASEGVGSLFSGTAQLAIADFVWKWAPNGDGSSKQFKLQGEYIHTQRDGELTGSSMLSSVNAAQSGWYLQALYRFMPRWRVGLRADRLDPGSWGRALAADEADYRPRRTTAIVEFSPSEFSRFRLQFAQDRSSSTVVDNQLQLQYQVLLGTHPAHAF